MKLKLLLFIVFLSVSQLFAADKVYLLNIVSAFCKCSEYEKIANASQSELEKFFNNNESYKIVGENYRLTGLNIRLGTASSKLLNVSFMQDVSSITSAVNPKIGDVIKGEF